MKYHRIFSLRALLPLVCQKGLRLFFPFFVAGLVISAALWLPVWAAVTILTVITLVATASAAFSKRLIARAGHVLINLLLAPVEALLLYLAGRETVLWAREGR